MTSSGNKPSIVFFGSGPVAAESLQLLQEYCEIEAIVTKPATVRDMTAIAPKVCVHSVNTKAELDNLINSQPFQSNLGILIDFGIIVSQKVIDSFEKGIINSHFSLLPEWRGADPITFSILSGQAKTGVSLMLIDEGMDTGKIITQKSLPVATDEAAPSLTHKLIGLSDSLLTEYIPKYLNDDVKPRQQSHPDRATYSRKIAKADGMLDFTKPAEQLEREIRAFADWPKSRTQIAGKDIVILQASVQPRSGPAEIGKIYKTEDKKIGIHCQNGDLIIEVLKPAGKKAMTSQAFLAGHQL